MNNEIVTLASDTKLEWKESGGTKQGVLSITGYASVFGVVDSYCDIINKGAFSNIASKEIPLLWQHDTKEPIGVIKYMQEDDRGLHINAEINLLVQKGAEAASLIKQNAITGLSIGFTIKDYEQSYQQRIIKQVNLLEVSVVTFPANEEAKIHETKIQQNMGGNMELKSITKQIEDVSSTLKNEITECKSNISDLQTILSRPEESAEISSKSDTEFTEYLRSGESSLITKSLSSDPDSDGGFLISKPINNSIINMINEKSVIRRLSSVETISSSSLDLLLEDGEFTSGWVAEKDTRDETDSSKIKRVRIHAHELYAQPKASQRLLDDSAVNIATWVKERLSNSFAKAENKAFLLGDGDAKPAGILACKEIESHGIIDDDLVGSILLLINDLHEDYLANAKFLMSRDTLYKLQSLKDETGRPIWQPRISEKLPDTLFGIPVETCSEMPKVGDEGESAPMVVLGDFKAAYKIVDRQSISVMRDPYTEKPFVKFYATKRVGGQVVNPQALKILTS